MTRPITAPGRPAPLLSWAGHRCQACADRAATRSQYYAPEILLAWVLVVLGGLVAHRVAHYDGWLAMGSLLLLTTGTLLGLFAMVQLLRDPA